MVDLGERLDGITAEEQIDGAAEIGEGIGGNQQFR